MTNLELLQRTVLFKDSSAEEIELILGLFQERVIKQNTVIFAENTLAESLYIVKSGTVRITMMAGDGQERGLLRLGPGDFIGELALVHEANRLVTAQAETPVELLVLTKMNFHAFIDLEPRTAARVLMTIAKLLAMRVRAYREKLQELLMS